VTARGIGGVILWRFSLLTPSASRIFEFDFKEFKRGRAQKRIGSVPIDTEPEGVDRRRRADRTSRSVCGGERGRT
jgi:hypothetical protein